MTPPAGSVPSGPPSVSVILLAAGYGTRLYPLTKNRPKALLELGDRLLLDEVIEQVRAVRGPSKVMLVSNHRFADQFQQWQQKSGKGVTVIDDGTDTPETRLGAIGDLQLGRKDIPPTDDLLVLGTDNLFTWSLAEFAADAASKRPSPSIALQTVATDKEASLYGVVELNNAGRVTRMVEKPKQPPSRLVSVCVYYFPAAMRGRFDEFLKSGGNPDAPGYFIEWLTRQESVYGHALRGDWFDIGSLEAYQQAVEFWTARRGQQRVK